MLLQILRVNVVGVLRDDERVYYKTGKFRAQAAVSQLSDLTPAYFGLQACDASVFGPQL